MSDPESGQGADAPVPTVQVRGRGIRRARGAHPWIFDGDIGEVHAAGGDVVAVEDPRGRQLGYAFYSDRSRIALRMLNHRREPPDAALWRHRLQDAIGFRRTLGIDAQGYRLVHAEGDLLPSIIVDRYGDHLVVQSLSQAAERLQPLIVQCLVELVQPAGILARNDPRVRELEGLERKVELLYGEVPELLRVRDGDVVMEVDLRHGQKTGLFLDQRENRDAAARYAEGRLLDCFSYHGAFALRLARGCEEVVALEISEEAAARIRRNAEINALSIDVQVANVFDRLREMQRRGVRFDTIVLDPPAFAKNRAAARNAAAGYKEINLRAMKLLPVGGHLVTCSCSYHVNEQQFGEILAAAAADVGAVFQLLERRGQSRDHRVRVGMPEGTYLKCAILRRLS